MHRTSQNHALCKGGRGAHKRLPRLPPGPRDRLGRDVVHGRRVRAAYCHSYHTGQASHPNRGMTDKGMGRALRASRPRGKRHGGQVREGLWSGLEWTRPFWRGARPFNVGSGEVSCSAWSSLCRSRAPECTCNIEGARPTARSGPQRAVHSTRPVCSVSFVGSPGRRLEIARSAPRVRRDGKRALVRVNGVVDGLMFFVVAPPVHADFVRGARRSCSATQQLRSDGRFVGHLDRGARTTTKRP